MPHRTLSAHFYTLLPEVFVRPTELHSLSAGKPADRKCSVTLFRQGGSSHLRRLCGYPLCTWRPQTA